VDTKDFVSKALTREESLLEPKLQVENSLESEQSWVEEINSVAVAQTKMGVEGFLCVPQVVLPEEKLGTLELVPPP
jgi:hypothetical protein